MEKECYSRLDERIKIIQQQQSDLEERIEETLHEHNEILQKTAVIEARLEIKNGKRIAEYILDLDQRINAIELASCRNKDRWNQMMNFIVQLAWVVLAAWVLTKLNLQPPSLP